MKNGLQIKAVMFVWVLRFILCELNKCWKIVELYVKVYEKNIKNHPY